MTATVETVSDQLDLAAIIPAEKLVSAVARSITLSDADVGKQMSDIVSILRMTLCTGNSNGHCTRCPTASNGSCSCYSSNRNSNLIRRQWQSNDRRPSWWWCSEIRWSLRQFLAYFCRKIQLLTGYATTTVAVHLSATHRTANHRKTGYTLLYAAVFERADSAWRCTSKSGAWSARFLHLVSREFADQKVSASEIIIWIPFKIRWLAAYGICAMPSIRTSLKPVYRCCFTALHFR